MEFGRGRSILGTWKSLVAREKEAERNREEMGETWESWEIVVQILVAGQYTDKEIELTQ